MSELQEICSYAKGKTNVSELTLTNYISTENMLPNKSGIVNATSLPTTATTQEYLKNDILVSNIRPYFKKIWYATKKGGCSNDVLVFRAKENIDSKFLYYLLADDAFFEYSMATSKGTKMPRGDKLSIMQYNVPDFDLTTQKQIASILSALDNKIELNNRINENLELQAQAIFKSWFVDFEPFGGVMPENWKIGSLSDIADVLSGKRPPMKQNNKTEDVDIPLVGAAAIMGYTNKFNHDDKILVIGRVGTHGIVQRFDYPCWTSDNTLVIKSNCYEYIYQILKLIDYKAINRGSTQPLITQGDLKKTEIIIPSKECLQKYEDVVGSLMYRYSQNRIENEKLALLRDTLLPKLMNGEIDVSKVKI
ncbi:MAG: restriction endonuclease subunit S [Oscillospiraceae bacterium]|nr:restriction endonuclease subunit S [Oscillospiraceae bacterium]